MVPIVIPVDELKEQFIGRYFLVKKQFRCDERSPEIQKHDKGHWFWSTIWDPKKHLSRRVLIASIAQLMSSYRGPDIFSIGVRDKVVPLTSPLKYL